MKKDRRWLLIILGILVVLIVGWIGWRWYNRDMVTVKSAQVTRGTIEAVVSASGIVDAPVYDLAPKMGGKIVAINVKEGHRVRGGATLAEFDDTTRLVAPANGIVAKINYNIGETVAMGMPVIVVVNYNISWIDAQIDEIDIASVRIGDKVKISSDVYPETMFEGNIYWIAPLAELRKVGGRVKMDEESYVFPCKIEILGKHNELKVNMSVNVDISTKRNNDALIVPREALFSKEDDFYVYTLIKNHAKETKIDVGIRSYSSVEAVAGLAEGDIVAITNVAKLKDKSRIKIER